jgi:rubrerythrin
MGVTFSADEVFEMAEEIERNGAAFYREVAGKATNEEMKNVFLSMAAMEDIHLRTFQEMREKLSGEETEETAFDPYDEATMYLRAMADSKGFEGMKNPRQKLSGNESIQELLNAAIEAEKNSVLFYVGLKGMVSARAGRDKVETIIREEVRHVADLRRQLTAQGA